MDKKEEASESVDAFIAEVEAEVEKADAKYKLTKNPDILREVCPNIIKSLISRVSFLVCGSIYFYKTGHNPFSRNTRKDMKGLRQGSLINNPLWVPTSEDNDQLQFQVGGAGLWGAYDFNYSHLHEGRSRNKFCKPGNLWAFPVPEILDAEPNDKTPDDLFKLFNFDHLISITKVSIDDLVKLGMVEEVSYETAFKVAGVLERHEECLTTLGIAEKTVFQVTPKGNSLIAILPAFGDSSSRKSEPHELAQQDKGSIGLPA